LEHTEHTALFIHQQVL